VPAEIAEMRRVKAGKPYNNGGWIPGIGRY
jgi:hypothetical protein